MVSREPDQHEDLLIEDGPGARAGVGILVPGLLVGGFIFFLWPTGSWISPPGAAAIAFVATPLSARDRQPGPLGRGHRPSAGRVYAPAARERGHHVN
jgi:hypothetical protein